MKKLNKKFDIIIVDSSDPVGPAESLYKKEFYESMSQVLSDSGIICTQGENLFLHLDIISDLLSFCRTLFPTVGYSNTIVPTYPSRSIGFVICTKDKSNRLPCLKKLKLQKLMKWPLL